MTEHDPAANRPGPGPVWRPRRWVAWAVVGVMLAAAGSFAYRWWKPSPTPVPDPDITAADPLDLDDSPPPGNPGYLGVEACVSCHATRVAEFRQTSHAHACRQPDDGPMPSGFNSDKSTYVTFDRSLQFEMTRTGRDYSQTGRASTRSGPRQSTSHIDLIYGANRKADEVFFTWRGNGLFELMTVWLHPTKRWANTSYDFQGDGTFSRATTPRCVECHNTWLDHAPGTTNEYDRQTAVLGIGCERCHGPGRDHVQHHQSHPDDKAAHDVVRPALLSRERLLEVCTQCHSNTPKLRGPAFSQRPGRPMQESYRLSTSRHPEDDHVANQVQYLRQSKCFQKSDTMTCVTCHNPHHANDARETAATRAACATCHKLEDCRDRPRLPMGVRDQCVSCHMPQRVWMNVHFHTSDDRYVPPIRRFQHRIAIDPVARKEVLLDWHRSQTGDENQRAAAPLRDELGKHWLKESESRRGEYRFLAAIGAAREALRLDLPTKDREKAQAALQAAIAPQAKIDAEWINALHRADEGRIPAAIDTLNGILQVKPDWAVVHSKLGTLYAMTGQEEKAVKHLEAVARHDPDNASGLAMLGWLAYLQDRPADAADFYQKANDIEPRDKKINYHWGLSLLKLGRWADAKARFQAVVAIDPHHAGGYQGLSHALREEGQPVEALRFARRAARLTSFQEPDILVTLAESYAAAGRRVEARVAAAKALDTTTGRNALDRATRMRMEALQANGKP